MRERVRRGREGKRREEKGERDKFVCVWIWVGGWSVLCVMLLLWKECVREREKVRTCIRSLFLFLTSETLISKSCVLSFN